MIEDAEFDVIKPEPYEGEPRTCEYVHYVIPKPQGALFDVTFYERMKLRERVTCDAAVTQVVDRAEWATNPKFHGPTYTCDEHVRHELISANLARAFALGIIK